MQSKHTPGPWVVDDKPGDSAGAVRIIGATGAVVALMKAAGGRKRANAALIAEAPAMLEALRATVACLRGFSASADFGPLDDEAVSAGLALLARIDGT